MSVNVKRNVKVFTIGRCKQEKAALRRMTTGAALALALGGIPGVLPADEPAAADAPQAERRELLGGLARLATSLEDAAFPEVVEATTGRRVLPIDPRSRHDRQLLATLGEVLDATLRRMNREDSPVRELSRINEASRLFEEEIIRQFGARRRWSCAVPTAADGGVQRSGYPDLQIIDRESGQVSYLDPKLYREDTGDSTFRSFYYEPQDTTGKITRDARHLVVGIAHDGNTGNWRFVRWRVVDMAGVRLRFKAEFQASNRDMYGVQPVASGAPGR